MNKQLQTITEQIYQVLRSDILHQRLRFGEKITTKALQERLGVSSTPIREALTQLQKDGLIVTQPNVGMHVVSYTRKDVVDIYTLMAELDAIALRLACNCDRRNEMMQELQALQAEAVRSLDRGDRSHWEDLSDRFHLIFYRFADNARLGEAAERTRNQLTVFSNAYQQSAPNQQEIQCQHDAVSHCLAAGDTAAAEEALRRHFASSTEKALQSWQELQT